MILVAYWHGLRASEVIGLSRDHVSDGFLTVKRLKNSLQTTQPLISSKDPLLDEAGALYAFMQIPGESKRLFPVTRRRFGQIMHEYGKEAKIPIQKRHPHALKHSIAKHVIHIAGIENVRQYLGHKSIASTGIYLKVTDEEAVRAVRRARRV